MSEFIVSGLNDELVTPMHCFLDSLLLDRTIPNTVERLALNIRSQETDQRFQPIELFLDFLSKEFTPSVRLNTLDRKWHLFHDTIDKVDCICCCAPRVAP